MKYVEKAAKGQKLFMPDCLEDYVSEDNPVRVIDAFVESLDMAALGFSKAEPKYTGRPAYDPRDMLRLYIYGYFNKIRTSRCLMRECGRNVELMFLMGKLTPDFRTISDFRKENAKAIKSVFESFAKLCVNMGLYKRELLAVDGTKIRAVNSDDHAYNAEILKRKLERIYAHIGEYLNVLDENDKNDTDKEVSEPHAGRVKEILAELNQRREKYEGYLKYLEESGETQILETDPEARRMHSKDGFHCYYNVQTAVDSQSHLIAGYEVTNHNTDQGLLNEVTQSAKELLGVPVIETVADKGYESRADILECIENGTMANVALKYDKDERVYNIDYIEADITEEVKASTNPEDISKCLHAGVLPDCYAGTSLKVELQEKSTQSCFIKNDDNTVTCPCGKILPKLKTRGENTVYGSKEACRECKNRCTSSKSFKTVQFSRDTQYVPVMMYGSSETKLNDPPPPEEIRTHTLDRKDYAKDKKVVLRIREDKQKLKERMCLSEHPFGTVKWYHGAHYVVCKGIEKASAEMGLAFLAYNLRRVINMVGVAGLMEAIRA